MVILEGYVEWGKGVTKITTEDTPFIYKGGEMYINVLGEELHVSNISWGIGILDSKGDEIKSNSVVIIGKKGKHEVVFKRGCFGCDISKRVSLHSDEVALEFTPLFCMNLDEVTIYPEVTHTYNYLNK